MSLRRVAHCADCAYTTIAYNSCRNRHCPKRQGAAAKDWLADREADFLPVPYYHVVFTLPAIADIVYQNKTVVRSAVQGLGRDHADDRRRSQASGCPHRHHLRAANLELGAHPHHPHVHLIVPGGGISPDGLRWVSCRPRFFLPVGVLSRLLRRLFLEKLVATHHAARPELLRR
ncbi:MULTISPECIES: IS91 family transposase [unclassified Bradyrhizobium]